MIFQNKQKSFIMKHLIAFLILCAITCTATLNTSCRSSHKKQVQDSTVKATTQEAEIIPESHLLTDSLLPQSVDLEQDISRLSYEELRILRSYPYALHGYWFIEGDLNHFFCRKTDWYYELCANTLYESYEKNTPYADTYDKVKLLPEEKDFVEKVDRRMAELARHRYITRKDCKLLSPLICVNFSQIEHPDGKLLALLDRCNFAIAPTDYEQLFNIYETNDYQQMPSFITTDVYLQAFHMYFSYVLKSLERNHFTPALQDVVQALHAECAKLEQQETVKAEAGYAATYFAIAHRLLTGRDLPVPAAFQPAYRAELQRLAALEDAPSDFLKTGDIYFPYSLFKPRGHYTRDEASRHYFQCMMWLQTASFCRETPEALWRTAVMAAALNRIPADTRQKCLKLDQAITFLMGGPDNASILEMAGYMERHGLADRILAHDETALRQTDDWLKELFKTRNRIRPKIQLSCADKINFMPARYMADNEILGEMADPAPNAERAYPKALDVFAAYGVESAASLLDTCYREEKNWKDYRTTADKMKHRFEGSAGKAGTMYDRCMEALVTLQRPGKDYPGFMQTPDWQIKNLNTALASWTGLKHDAVLYGEQPIAMECGGGSDLATPIVVGYVEPNLAFWKKLKELVARNRQLLTETGFADEDLMSKGNILEEQVDFCLRMTEKELRGETLTQEEYMHIQKMGSSIEWFTLSVIEPGLSYDWWGEVKGAERSIAIVSDVFTRNVRGCGKNGILHEATGTANAIYVLVDIGGQTYLTRGATYSYYEFVRPLGERLTDEEWQKILQDGKAPDVPSWIRPYLLEQAPEVDEHYFYSSGC